MNRIGLIGVLLVTVLTLAGVQAAEAPATPAPSAESPTAEAEAPPVDDPAGAEGDAPEPEDDVFVPSVEVSEDRSVPFPVDI